MLKSVDAKDFNQTLDNLEDAIFLAVDKLHAISTAQSQLDSNDCQLEPIARTHLSLVMEDQVKELRSLLEQHFG